MFVLISDKKETGSAGVVAGFLSHSVVKPGDVTGGAKRSRRRCVRLTVCIAAQKQPR